MKKKLHVKTISVLVGGLFVFACSNNDDVKPTPIRSVEFTASMNPVSRATDTSFDNGDAIGVFATTENSLSNTNFADNVKYAYNAIEKVFSSSNPIEAEEGTSLKYYAVYPYSSAASTGSTYTFEVKADQTGSGYTNSDLCMAISGKTTDEKVDLKFNHCLSKVIFNLSGSGWSSNVNIALKNVYTQCNVNLNNMTVEFSGNGNKTVKLALDGNNAFKSVIPSQILESERTKVVVTMDGISYEYSFDTDITLNSGKQIQFSLNAPQPDVEYNTISFGGDINNWDDEQVADQLFEEPFLSWGASQSVVKEYLNNKGYQELGSEGNMLMYYGKYREMASAYLFTSAKLSQAIVLFDNEQVKKSQIENVLSKNYIYVGTQDGLVGYSTIDEKTLIILETETIEGTTTHSLYYMPFDTTRGIISYTGLETIKNFIKIQLSEL